VLGSVTVGQCNAVCTPGNKQCAGTSSNIPQTCNSAGQWANDAITAGRCGAVCNPGDTQCLGSDAATFQPCTSSGAWGTAALTVGKCGVVCDPSQNDLNGWQCYDQSTAQGCLSNGRFDGTVLSCKTVCGQYGGTFVSCANDPTTHLPCHCTGCTGSCP
jgi:hypothetical protein